MNDLQDPKSTLRRLGAPFYARPPELAVLQRGLLGFHYRDGYYYGAPNRAFEPKGLLLWNAPPLSRVNAIIINREQITVGFDLAPSRWFSTAKNFDELATMVADGNEPVCWNTWDFVGVGQQVRIGFTSEEGHLLRVNDVELAMWGLVSPP